MSASEGSVGTDLARVLVARFFATVPDAAFFAVDLRARRAGLAVAVAADSVEAVVASLLAGAAVSAPAVLVLEVFGTIFGKIAARRNTARSTITSRFFGPKRLRSSCPLGYARDVRHFVFRWIVTMVAVMVAASFIRGIRYDSTGSLLGAALLLGVLNAFVRPVLLILSAPLILFSLGFFILVVNALMLRWVPAFVPGFHVETFGSVFWGAIVIGVVSWTLSAFFRGSDGHVHVLTHHTQIKRVQGRVIGADESTLK